MRSKTTFLFYQTILVIGYHSVDINKDVIKLLFTFRDCHSLVSDMGGGESNQKMTMCDMGGGGSKIPIFGVTYFLHGPLGGKNSLD